MQSKEAIANFADQRFRLSDENLKTYERDSVLNLGVLFSLQEVKAVIAAFDRIITNNSLDIYVIREDGSEIPRSVMGWENSDPILNHFATDERVLGAVQSVIGNDVVFHQTKYNPKAPNGAGEKWDPHRGITFWHYLDGVPDPLKMVSIFVALTDQTKENGASYTWTGAHNMSLSDLRDETDFDGRSEGEMSSDTASYLSLQIKSEKIDEYDRRFERMHLEGPAGTVWLLDSRNLHASQPNLSNLVRILVANVYRSVDNTPIHPRDSSFLCNTQNVPMKASRGSLV